VFAVADPVGVAGRAPQPGRPTSRLDGPGIPARGTREPPVVRVAVPDGPGTPPAPLPVAGVPL